MATQEEVNQYEKYLQNISFKQVYRDNGKALKIFFPYLNEQNEENVACAYIFSYTNANPGRIKMDMNDPSVYKDSKGYHGIVAVVARDKAKGEGLQSFACTMDDDGYVITPEEPEALSPDTIVAARQGSGVVEQIAKEEIENHQGELMHKCRGIFEGVNETFSLEGSLFPNELIQAAISEVPSLAASAHVQPNSFEQ